MNSLCWVLRTLLSGLTVVRVDSSDVWAHSLCYPNTRPSLCLEVASWHLEPWLRALPGVWAGLPFIQEKPVLLPKVPPDMNWTLISSVLASMLILYHNRNYSSKEFAEENHQGKLGVIFLHIALEIWSLSEAESTESNRLAGLYKAAFRERAVVRFLHAAGLCLCR